MSVRKQLADARRAAVAWGLFGVNNVALWTLVGLQSTLGGATVRRPIPKAPRTKDEAVAEARRAARIVAERATGGVRSAAGVARGVVRSARSLRGRR